MTPSIARDLLSGVGKMNEKCSPNDDKCSRNHVETRTHLIYSKNV